MLDRVLLGFFSAVYLLGALALALEYRRTEDAIIRQQLKWLRNGAILGFVPFTGLYVVPTSSARARPLHATGGAFPALIPLTWAYAIVRYRLMDVDVIFQQGYVYTLATLGVLGVFYAPFPGAWQVEDLSPTAIVTLIFVATFVFQPIRNWIQEQLDRYYFYKDRYDYRRTLVEFARELSSETDLDNMLESVADRLLRTLSIRHVAFFLQEARRRKASPIATDTSPCGWPPVRSSGIAKAKILDLSFLPTRPEQPYLFFERTRHALDVVSQASGRLPSGTPLRISISHITCPCAVRGRTIAYLGVSRTEKGDFLSSDDWNCS